MSHSDNAIFFCMKGCMLNTDGQSSKDVPCESSCIVLFCIIFFFQKSLSTFEIFCFQPSLVLVGNGCLCFDGFITNRTDIFGLVGDMLVKC